MHSLRSRIAVASTAALLLAPLVASDAAGQDPPALTTDALIEILSADERLDALSAEDRTGALEEAANWGTLCEHNVTSDAHYDCGCFARAMLGFRFEEGFERTATLDAVPPAGQSLRKDGEPAGQVLRTWNPLTSRHVDEPLPECLSPEKLAAYTTRELRQMGPLMGDSADETAELTPCVVDAVVARYQTEFGGPWLPHANPGVLIETIGKALNECKGK